jgi:CO dehydrogenase nickel-insertion accessory protein CooC1
MNKLNEKPLSGTRIGIFGKGGSGKSTFTVLLTMTLRERGYHVCLLDADSTNIGLAKALGFEKSPVPMLGYFGGMVFSGGDVTCPVDDPTPLAGADVLLETLPAQYFVQEDGITLFIAGKIGDQGPGAGCDGPVSKIARDLRIHSGAGQIVTLIDFKAGFEDSARGAITSLDWAFVVVDPTLAAIEMANDMQNMVSRMKALELPATMHLENTELVAIANRLFTEAKIKGVLFVINKIRDPEMEMYLRKELLMRGIEPLGTIFEDPSVSIAWLKGYPLDMMRTKREIQKIATALESAEALAADLEVSTSGIESMNTVMGT